MKKVIYSIIVGLLLTLGIIGTSSIEVDATVIVNSMDFDLNGSIGIEDIATLSSKYQLTSDSNNWSPKFDLNNDNIIDIYDVVLISKAIGTSTIVNDNTDITSKFIDEKFKTHIYTIIKKNSSAPILYSDVKGITEIKADSLGISNLSGIEYFTSLTDLECGENAIRTLNLSNNTKLTDLYCSSNQLEGLNLTSNTELINLDCTNNAIRTLNLSNNIKLEVLLCPENKLTSLNININSKLEYLDCYSNELTALDVSKNEALWWLNCNFNNITTLDLSANTRLMGLECKNNQLTTLDLSKNAELGRFNCTGNQIITLYATKDIWDDNSHYKEQYTDASHKITTNSLTVKIIGRGYTTTKPSGENVVRYAMNFLGRPYVYGAAGPDNFDCSGLTAYVYRTAAGIEIGRTTYDQINAGVAVSQAELQPGDLVFTSSSHVGIYVGDGSIIHCPQTGDVVKVSNIWAFYAGRRIIA